MNDGTYDIPSKVLDPIADEERILRIGKDENKNCGIKELLK